MADLEMIDPSQSLRDKILWELSAHGKMKMRDLRRRSGLRLSDELGKYEEALEAHNKSIELDPRLAYAWVNKSNALNKLGRNEEDLLASEKAIQLDPKLAIAWNNKGEALKLLGRNMERMLLSSRPRS